MCKMSVYLNNNQHNHGIDSLGHYYSQDKYYYILLWYVSPTFLGDTPLCDI